MKENTKELLIRKPSIITMESGGARLVADIHLGDEIRKLWFEVNNDWADYLTEERSDAFVVNLLYYAMIKGYNIVTEGEISEKLHYQLEEYWIPTLAKCIKQYRLITIKAPLNNNPLKTYGGVGTGISGGADSFFTLLSHMNRTERGYNVSHVTFLNLGGVGYSGIRQATDNRVEHLRSVADELGLQLVVVDTNEAEFYQGIRHVETHPLRTLSQVLALQKLFSKYYFSSTFSTYDFKVTTKDAAYYDLMTIPLLSTESLSFFSHDAKTSRIEKLDFISTFPVTYDKLTVCIRAVKNCGMCEKCKRTMLELDLLGKLELYASSFNVEMFAKNKQFFLMESVSRRKAKQFWQEIYDGYKNKGMISFNVLFWGNIMRLFSKKKADRFFSFIESSGESSVIKALWSKLVNKRS